MKPAPEKMLVIPDGLDRDMVVSISPRQLKTFIGTASEFFGRSAG